MVSMYVNILFSMDGVNGCMGWCMDGWVDEIFNWIELDQAGMKYAFNHQAQG